MVTASQTAHFSPIGAFELKRCYRKNMMLANLFVIAGITLIIGVIALIKVLTAKEAIDAPTLIIKSLSELGPPPSVAKKQVQVKVSQKIAPPSFNLPEAVPDEEVVEDFVVVSQEELAEITSPVLGEGDGEGIVVDIPIGDYLPTPDEFIAVEEQPEPIQLASPKYPEMARKAEIEGTVWVKVLVDKDGKILDAIILKESGTNAGFEEAALEAAKKGIWKPAIQNKQPVRVWASYPIRFTLKNRK